MPTYAQNTSVTSDKSRAEIERTLARYGAISFMYGWDQARAVIAFEMNGRRLKFILPMPERDSREFTHTPAKNQRRSAAAAEAAYDQAVRQRWRALALFSEQMLAAGEDVTLLNSEDWIIRTATALVLMSAAGDEVRELEPSERFEALNDYLLEAAEHFDQVVILLPEGIDELDVEKINQASEEMLLGQLAIENATAEIQRLAEEEGVGFSDQ